MDPYELAIFASHAANKEAPIPRLSLPAVVTYDGINLAALIALQSICQKCLHNETAMEKDDLIQLSMVLWLLTFVSNVCGIYRQANVLQILACHQVGFVEC